MPTSSRSPAPAPRRTRLREIDELPASAGPAAGRQPAPDRRRRACTSRSSAGRDATATSSPSQLGGRRTPGDRRPRGDGRAAARPARRLSAHQAAAPTSRPRSASAAGVFGAEGERLEAAAPDGDGGLRPAPPARLLSVAGPRSASGWTDAGGAPPRAGIGDRPAGRPDALHRRHDRRAWPSAPTSTRSSPTTTSSSATSTRSSRRCSGACSRALPTWRWCKSRGRPRARCAACRGQRGDRRLHRRRAPAPRCRPGAPRRPGRTCSRR